MHFRAKFPSKKNEIGILEKVIGINGNRNYQISSFFTLKEMISNMQIKTYSYELLKLNNRLEDIFKWFFEVYLKNEFNVDGFIFSPISSDSTFLEKVRTICSELDSILRQFNSYVKDGVINRELLEISRTSIMIEDVPSFSQRKYGYITDNELINISHLLFSDQSQISYIEGKEEYLTFEELIKNEKIKITDFLEYQKRILELLIGKNIIWINTDKYIQLNKEIVSILKDYYLNEVICINYYKNNKTLNTLISDKKIDCESKLFSRPEQKYINFILNDRDFDNGPALRNKYAHGNNTQNIYEHENNYFQILKIFVLLIIKINEEFCLRDEN